MANSAEEIKNRCNIVDVVGRYVKLRRSGSNYMGLCPFHSEKTPSFSVSEKGQFFHCFGCGESGDVITFIEKIENVDFRTALQKLADMYGINLDDYGFTNESRKNKFYVMNRDAAVFFLHQLSDRPNPGRDYIMNRGLDIKTISKFGIGFAPDSWHSLIEYMKSKGYDEHSLYEAGLISYSKGNYYDKFRGRVIFPIINTRGKVIGFGGRIIGSGEPKYLNSPESIVFSKRDNLFGLNLTRDSIRQKDCAVIVEGYMDMVSLYQSGVTYTAATLGTALTPAQCSMLGRYTKHIVLSYDADSAGRSAALRGIEVIRNAGLDVKVLHVPDGKDPDEFIRKHGKEAFEKLIENALPYVDYKLEHEKSLNDTSTEQGRLGYIKGAARVLAGISPAEAELYIKKITDETWIQEGALRAEIRQAQSGRQAYEQIRPVRQEHAEAENHTSDEDLRLQHMLIGIASKDPSSIALISKYDYIFTDPVCFRIYNTIKEFSEEKAAFDADTAADSMGADDARVFLSITKSKALECGTDVLLDECIRTIKEKELRKKSEYLNSELKLLSEDDDTRITEIMVQMKNINAEIQHLRSNTGE